MEEKKKELEVTKDALPAELQADFDSDLEKNMDGIQARLPQIAINHKEGTFSIPTSSGNDIEEELVGIILHHQRVNVYFISVEDKKPTCFSLDAKVPESGQTVVKQAQHCVSCQKNQFGSGKDGTGKACKNMIRLHVKLDNSIIPLRLSVPPTSIAEYEQFVTMLSRELTPLISLKTKLTLEKKERGSIIWSILKFKNQERLNVEQWQEMRSLKKKYLDSMVRQPIEVEEYGGSGSNEEEIDTPF